MNPTVSIVMPNYNSKWIGEAISSVVNQTYEDWRLIVVDDGSTDCGRSIVDLFAREERERIFRYFLPENSGSPVMPRNVGIGAALETGCRYVAFLDSDDKWSPDKLEKQIGYMESAYGCWWSYHDLYLLGGRKQRWSQLSDPHEGHCFRELLFKNFIPSSSVVLRSELLRREKVWHKSEYRISHDWEFWLRLIRRYPIGYIPLALGSLRMNGVTSNTRRRRKESRRVVRLWRSQVLLGYLWKCLGYYYLAEVYDLWRKIKCWRS